MRSKRWAWAAVLVAALAGDRAAAEKPVEGLRAEIGELVPARHAWQAVAWRDCPLEALAESRRARRPVIVWMFLGRPSDERC